jgi:anti-sigma-K factor RskA
MTGGPPDIPEEIQVLAGEYVLGVLDPAEMRTVRQRAAEDRRLAEAIAAWEQRLTPLARAVPPVAPPPGLWSRLEAAIAVPAHAAEEMGETPTLHVPPERLVPPPRSARSGRARRPRRVWPWQLATAASLALAAGMAAFTLLPHPEQPLRIAALTPANTMAQGFVAEARANGTVLLTALAPLDVPAGHDLELWILPKGARTPTPLGVLPASGRRIVLTAPPEPGTQLMVSLEPQGGSPTGAPTGPVLYAGTFGGNYSE